MGKTGRWIKSFLTGGKKEKEKEREDTKEKERIVNHGSSPLPAENRCGTPVSTPTPKEKRRWSFRRSSATKDLSSELVPASPSISASFEAEFEQQKHAIAVAQATAAAANAAVAAAQAAAAVIRLTATTSKVGSVEQIAAIKIQSTFRSYLARKALCALKGLVKLQALVRGHLVRKQATATLRCMQALVMVQVRARAQRMLMSEEPQPNMSQRQSVHRRSPQDNRIRQSYSAERGMEENVKIVEMDLGESRLSSKTRNSYSSPQSHEGVDHRPSTHYSRTHSQSKLDHNIQISLSPSALTDLSPRACSGHFDEYSFTTAQSSPQCFSAVSKPDPTAANFTFPRQDYVDCMSQDYPFFPNYMANTESSKAKVRSQSAPKQRPITYERQTSRRRSSMEGRNIPRSVRMQRSSSHVGSAVNGYQPPWSVKLDRSTASLKDSECGSTSTVLTNSNYCRSLVAFEVHANRH